MHSSDNQLTLFPPLPSTQNTLFLHRRGFGVEAPFRGSNCTPTPLRHTDDHSHRGHWSFAAQQNYFYNILLLPRPGAVAWLARCRTLR